MDRNDFKNMSNNDINIKMKSLENEYETVKKQVLKLIDKMKNLDVLYNEGKKELTKRNKGIF